MNFIKLIRLEQWYKNLVIFVPLLFAPKEYLYSITNLVIGFFGFCCISSVTYIINDWMDREKDRMHPVKKERPLASGKISGKTAILIGFLLSLIVIGAIIFLGWFYGIIVITYFIITNLYSFGLKNVPLVDSLIIGFNFVLRMMAGTKIIPDLDTAPYFGLMLGIIIIFLTHKRSNDIKIVGINAVKHKPVLKFYTKKNNYIVRSVGYLIAIASFYILYLNGFAPYKAGGILALLILTSYLMSKEPAITSKPQKLLKNIFWDMLFACNLVLIIFY